MARVCRLCSAAERCFQRILLLRVAYCNAGWVKMTGIVNGMGLLQSARGRDESDAREERRAESLQLSVPECSLWRETVGRTVLLH